MIKSIYSKLIIATGLLFFVSVCSFAQKDFQGKAYYYSKTSVDMTNFGRPGMSEEQKKRIADRMKSMFEKTYILTFTQSESIYKEEEKLEAPSEGGRGGGRFAMMSSSFTGGPQYKNVKSKELLQDQEFFGKQFLIKDSLPQYNWEMGSETKQIGKYMCFKATATIQSNAYDFTNFRRRPDREETNNKKQDSVKVKATNKEENTTREIKIVAWYTMQIPVNQGPGEYWGLPGLILEVNTDKTTILCSKIVMNPEEKSTIKVPTKGKKVTREAYNVIVKKKTEEMRENFRGRGGRGGGNRRS
ncbi:GLPGLI family protein [Flavivirga aquimarina]|uniref:GLPGLI family protein n=1 Tax=Flavivirga aquimarina TaxID=2027862 RepID=A0ABT8WAW3_9FLAO|nr:GLPGLI family protein [Flavivirga aquimarina]MDO5970246.1 GLPGLI family protein [Flavivirga aquimarina]